MPSYRLTEKMKNFCREYVGNGGKAGEAYMAAYDSQSPVSANVESTKLLRREDIQGYIADLRKPLEIVAITTALTEREQKRQVLWDIINNAESNADKCRAMDILNKMDNEYININRNIEDNSALISDLDDEVLRKLSGVC
jgi:phage terminase small subunit